MSVLGVSVWEVSVQVGSLCLGGGLCPEGSLEGPCPGRSLSGGLCPWGLYLGISIWQSVQAVLCPVRSLFRRVSVQGVSVQRRLLSRGLCLWVSVQGSLSREGCCLGGLCPWGPYLGVSGSLSRQISVQSVSVQSGHCSEGSLSRKSLSMGSLSRGGCCLGGHWGGSLSGGSLFRGVSVWKETPSPLLCTEWQMLLKALPVKWKMSAHFHCMWLLT